MAKDPDAEKGRSLPRALVWLMAGAAIVHLYATLAGVGPFRSLPTFPTYLHRQFHLGSVLIPLFLGLALSSRSARDRTVALILAALSFAAFTITIAMGDRILEHVTDPSAAMLVIGVAVIALVLEATRRTTGWAMPLIAAGSILYAFGGRYLPEPWSHRGYGLDRLVGHLFIGPEGIFGTPISVSATLIVLFTIYGAILAHSGAAEVFVQTARRLFGSSKRGALGTVVLSSFLLGGPSGSGVATTVMIGSVAHPLLARRGYSPSQAGGLLAAAGIGAVISPPVLGSAAFLLAEMLAISYLDVLKMVILPTFIFYASIYLIAEFSAPPQRSDEDGWSRSGAGTLRVCAHFLSAGCILIYLAMGFSPETSAVLSILTAIALWITTSERRPSLTDIVDALADGMKNVFAVAAICASAGIVIGVITLTGLGLNLSGIIIHVAGNDLLMATLFAALCVWIVGLAVPITGSYIICAIVVAPALISIGANPVTAHMFIFYLAVLSEVSPPTALAPFAAAAITGAKPFRTTLQAWRFTACLFVLPFVLMLEPYGQVLLLRQAPTLGDSVNLLSYLIGNLALILAIANRLSGLIRPAERVGFVVSAILLVFPATLAAHAPVGIPVAICAGLLLFGSTLVFHFQRRRIADTATAAD